MYIDVFHILSLINTNISDKVLYAVGQHKEVDAKIFWLVFILLPHTEKVVGC